MSQKESALVFVIEQRAARAASGVSVVGSPHLLRSRGGHANAAFCFSFAYASSQVSRRPVLVSARRRRRNHGPGDELEHQKSANDSRESSASAVARAPSLCCCCRCRCDESRCFSPLFAYSKPYLERATLAVGQVFRFQDGRGGAGCVGERVARGMEISSELIFPSFLGSHRAKIRQRGLVGRSPLHTLLLPSRDTEAQVKLSGVIRGIDRASHRAPAAHIGPQKKGHSRQRRPRPALRLALFFQFNLTADIRDDAVPAARQDGPRHPRLPERRHGGNGGWRERGKRFSLYSLSLSLNVPEKKGEKVRQ